MAKPKRSKKKNPVVNLRRSDLRNFQSDIIDNAYKMFMAIALTTVLDKHDAQDWVMDYLQEMNELLQEVNRDKVSIQDLADVLEDEYGIVLDYERVK